MTFLRTESTRQAGFTIVELMVGMLIGLISVVVMFQVFAVSESQRRTTAGAGEAQQNGVTSLFLLERDARLAGYGLNYFPLLGCTVNAYYTPTAQAFSYILAPAVIQDGAGGTAPDTVTILYSGTDSFAFPGTISPPSTDKTPGYVTLKDARFPFNNGDLFVIGEVPVPPAAMKPCSMFQVTDTPGGDYANWVKFDGQFYQDATLTTRPAYYNPNTSATSVQPPPNSVYYKPWQRTTNPPSGGRLLALGAQPVVRQYSIVNNQLVAKDLLRPDQPAIPIADSIVQFQVQYGFSAGCPLVPPAPPAIQTCSINPSTAKTVGTINTASLTLDQWGDKLDKAPGVASPQDWRRVIALRFVVVARSIEKDAKRDITGKVDPVAGTCRTTMNPPKWMTNNAQDLDVSNGGLEPDWQCYRYKTFETVVPIRNLLWYPDPSGFAANN